jgi:hypothetical protein
MASEFQIGTTLLGMQPLDTLLETSQGIDPDWSFKPYSTWTRLANKRKRGNGFPIAIWRWNGLSLSHRQTLRDLISPDLSGPVYIRTATNDIDDVYEEIVYKTFQAEMNWTEEDEDIQAGSDLGVIITFTHLIEAS